MGARITLTVTAALAALLLVAGPAFADDPVDPAPPIDATTVPPLVSEPLDPPPASTTPEGDFTNCCTVPAPPQTTPPPVDYSFPAPTFVSPVLSWTPAQLEALRRLSHDGSSYRIDTAPDGTLLIQDIAGYTVDNSPNPWVLMGLDGSSVLLAPSTASTGSSAPSTNPTLRMDIPTSSGISFIATNTSPVDAMVLVTWEVGDSRVNRWKRLAPGEVWISSLEAPAGASTTKAGVLITQSTSEGRYENDMVGIVAATKGN